MRDEWQERGYCFKWMRGGECSQRKDGKCRFEHPKKGRLVAKK